MNNASYFVEEQRPNGEWEDVTGIPDDTLELARSHVKYLIKSYPDLKCNYRIVKHTSISEIIEEIIR